MRSSTFNPKSSATAKTDSTKHLTLCGSFGWGHAREAAVALAVADMANAEGYSVDINLLGGKKAGALTHVTGIGSEDELRRQELKGNPVLVTGHGVIEPSAHAVLLRCAPYLKAPFAPWTSLFGAAVDLGASYPLPLRWKFRPILKRMRNLLVTDLISASLMEPLVGKRTVEVVGEPCLSLQPGAHPAPEVQGLDRMVIVALTTRWSRSPDWRRWIACRLSELSAQLSATIVFMPTSIAREDDRAEARSVAHEMQRHSDDVNIVCMDRLLDPREMAATMGKATLVLAMRLHPCVIAYGQRTPFVALLQHPKLYNFACTVGCRQNVFPSVSHDQIHAHAHGYDFAHLPLNEGSLVQSALNALRKTSFDSLDEFRNKQRAYLKELLDACPN